MVFWMKNIEGHLILTALSFLPCRRQSCQLRGQYIGAHGSGQGRELGLHCRCPPVSFTHLLGTVIPMTSCCALQRRGQGPTHSFRARRTLPSHTASCCHLSTASRPPCLHMSTLNAGSHLLHESAPEAGSGLNLKALPSCLSACLLRLMCINLEAADDSKDNHIFPCM
jgi:hypothetical protein